MSQAAVVVASALTTLPPPTHPPARSCLQRDRHGPAGERHRLPARAGLLRPGAAVEDHRRRLRNRCATSPRRCVTATSWDCAQTACAARQVNKHTTATTSAIRRAARADWRPSKIGAYKRGLQKRPYVETAAANVRESRRASDVPIRTLACCGGRQQLTRLRMAPNAYRGIEHVTVRASGLLEVVQRRAVAVAADSGSKAPRRSLR